MTLCLGLSTDRILEAFTQEITARGGEVTDTFHDGQRLFARGVLNLTGEVRSRDRVDGGVALKAAGGDVSVHPYVFRQVCQNGAIMAETLTSERLTNLDWPEPEEALRRIKAAVADCSQREVFEDSVDQMRSAAELEVDTALLILSAFSEHSAHPKANYLASIMDRFFRDEELSGFGLMQAITSVARDTRDEALRWDLEELGGSVAARNCPQPSWDTSRSLVYA